MRTSFPRNLANLDRLAAALHEIDARLWVGPTEPNGLAVRLDRTTLAAIDGFLNLVTRCGPLDITFVLDGTGGYPDLAGSAVTIRLLGVEVPVAALEDVIRSKEAAGRDKDIAVLPALIEFLRNHENSDKP